jgi:hypothetical protein
LEERNVRKRKEEEFVFTGDEDRFNSVLCLTIHGRVNRKEPRLFFRFDHRVVIWNTMLSPSMDRKKD